MSKKSPAAYDIATGARIREIRITRGISQEKLGEACGISWQQIQKYEKGTNRVAPSRLNQIAATLHVTPADLLPKCDLAGEALPILDDFQVKAAQIMGKIPVEQRATALAVLRQFAEG